MGIKDKILATDEVDGWQIVTYEDGMYQTDVTRSIIPPDDMVWTMGRCPDPEEALKLHNRIVGELELGITPGGEG